MAVKKQFRSECAKQKKIQAASTFYVKTETVDSFNGQMWNYPRKIRKHKLNDSIEQSS